MIFFFLFIPSPSLFCAFPLSPISDGPDQHDAGLCVDLTACSVSLHAVSAYMLLPTSPLVSALSPAPVSTRRCSFGLHTEDNATAVALIAIQVLDLLLSS